MTDEKGKEKTFKAMKAVYCYFFPETRVLLREVQDNLPDDMYLVTTPAEKVKKDLSALFRPPLEIPATQDGYVSLDEIHVPVIERILKVYSPVVSGIEKFQHRYPTSGSSEGIREILKKLQVGGEEEINVLEGEYEGFGEYAKMYGMRVNHVNPSTADFEKMPRGVWFISNPSARDGNIIDNDFVLKELCGNGHKVVLDLAYVGATRPYNFSVDHENISAVVMSFSKTYGAFRFRAGGFTLSREDIPALYGNKWFKDTLRLLQALKIAEDIGPSTLHAKYRDVQQEIADEINKEYEIGMKTSDSILLGYLPSHEATRLDIAKLNLIMPYKRGNVYRFCLTPYFEEREREKEGRGKE